MRLSERIKRLFVAPPDPPGSEPLILGGQRFGLRLSDGTLRFDPDVKFTPLCQCCTADQSKDSKGK